MVARLSVKYELVHIHRGRELDLSPIEVGLSPIVALRERRIGELPLRVGELPLEELLELFLD